LSGAGGKKKYIRDLQAQMSNGNISTARREEIVKELDALVAEAWYVTSTGIQFTACSLVLIVSSILCGDHAIKQIDKPFISASETTDEWAL
jgi:hypothetical protein